MANKIGRIVLFIGQSMMQQLAASKTIVLNPENFETKDVDTPNFAKLSAVCRLTGLEDLLVE